MVKEHKKLTKIRDRIPQSQKWKIGKHQKLVLYENGEGKHIH